MGAGAKNPNKHLSCTAKYRVRDSDTSPLQTPKDPHYRVRLSATLRAYPVSLGTVLDRSALVLYDKYRVQCHSPGSLSPRIKETKGSTSANLAN